MSPVPPRVTCATMAVRRWILVTNPRLIAKASCTCCPLRSPRFSVSTNTPLALKFLALQIRLFRPDITTYTVVRARWRVCKRRSIRYPFAFFEVGSRHYAHRQRVSEGWENNLVLYVRPAKDM